MFALRSLPNNIPIKYRGPIKKTSHLGSIDLQHDDLDSCKLTNTSDANHILKVTDMSTSRLVVVLSQLCFSKPILGILSQLWYQMIFFLDYILFHAISLDE